MRCCEVRSLWMCRSHLKAARERVSALERQAGTACDSINALKRSIATLRAEGGRRCRVRPASELSCAWQPWKFPVFGQCSEGRVQHATGSNGTAGKARMTDAAQTIKQPLCKLWMDAWCACVPDQDAERREAALKERLHSAERARSEAGTELFASEIALAHSKGACCDHSSNSAGVPCGTGLASTALPCCLDPDVDACMQKCARTQRSLGGTPDAPACHSEVRAAVARRGDCGHGARSGGRARGRGAGCAREGLRPCGAGRSARGARHAPGRVQQHRRPVRPRMPACLCLLLRFAMDAALWSLHDCRQSAAPKHP